MASQVVIYVLIMAAVWTVEGLLERKDRKDEQ